MVGTARHVDFGDVGVFLVFDRRLGVPGSPKRKRLGIVFWMDE